MSEEKEPFQPSAHWALGSRPLYFDLAQLARGGGIGGRGGGEKSFQIEFLSRQAEEKRGKREEAREAIEGQIPLIPPPSISLQQGQVPRGRTFTTLEKKLGILIQITLAIQGNEHQGEFCAKIGIEDSASIQGSPLSRHTTADLCKQSWRKRKKGICFDQNKRGEGDCFECLSLFSFHLSSPFLLAQGWPPCSQTQPDTLLLYNMCMCTVLVPVLCAESSYSRTSVYAVLS